MATLQAYDLPHAGVISLQKQITTKYLLYVILMGFVSVDQILPLNSGRNDKHVYIVGMPEVVVVLCGAGLGVSEASWEVHVDL